MNTVQLYNPLINCSSDEAGTLASVIKDLVKPQAIFQLGLAKTAQKATTIFFTQTLPDSLLSHAYFLVLVDKDREHKQDCIQDKIENNLRHHIPSTAIVLATETFMHWLSNGHPFAVKVLAGAEMLHQCETLLFPVPAPINEEEIKKETQTLYIQTKNRLESFMAGADLYRIRQDYKLAAFMLHQATEQALRTMLIINTGYRANTHSIDKLIRYCSMFCCDLPGLFPKANERSKKLYSLLNKAYIDTRYKDDYCISYEELTALTEKVKTIHTLFEKNHP